LPDVFCAPGVTETGDQEIELEWDLQTSIFGIRLRVTALMQSVVWSIIMFRPQVRASGDSL